MEGEERKVNLHHTGGCIVGVCSTSIISVRLQEFVQFSFIPALTFAVPLCILNVDIPAHISDDWGVFIRGDGVSGCSSAH